jgi:hypothetical protein
MSALNACAVRKLPLPTLLPYVSAVVCMQFGSDLAPDDSKHPCLVLTCSVCASCQCTVDIFVPAFVSIHTCNCRHASRCVCCGLHPVWQ